MKLRQTTLTESFFRHGARVQTADRRQQSRWRRQMRVNGLNASDPPPQNVTLSVESATEIAFILQKYSDHVLHKKYVVEIITPLGEGRRKRKRSRFWTLTPAFIDRFLNGYEVTNFMQTGSDYEETESFIEAATGPITLNI
eukprot:scaffold180698_cov27-Tisochrysis_lutea.AAC.1